MFQSANIRSKFEQIQPVAKWPIRKLQNYISWSTLSASRKAWSAWSISTFQVLESFGLWDTLNLSISVLNVSEAQSCKVHFEARWLRFDDQDLSNWCGFATLRMLSFINIYHLLWKHCAASSYQLFDSCKWCACLRTASARTTLGLDDAEQHGDYSGTSIGSFQFFSINCEILWDSLSLYVQSVPGRKHWPACSWQPAVPILEGV